MRRLPLHFTSVACVFCFSLSFLSIVPAYADEWMLRVETSGRVCHVQKRTASPLGEDFKGPFATRKATCTEAKDQYDDSTTDTGKCWTYGRGTVTGCKLDGITLPPQSLRKKQKT